MGREKIISQLVTCIEMLEHWRDVTDKIKGVSDLSKIDISDFDIKITKPIAESLLKKIESEINVGLLLSIEHPDSKYVTFTINAISALSNFAPLITDKQKILELTAWFLGASSPIIQANTCQLLHRISLKMCVAERVSFLYKKNPRAAENYFRILISNLYKMLDSDNMYSISCAINLLNEMTPRLISTNISENCFKKDMAKIISNLIKTKFEMLSNYKIIIPAIAYLNKIGPNSRVAAPVLLNLLINSNDVRIRDNSFYALNNMGDANVEEILDVEYISSFVRPDYHTLKVLIHVISEINSKVTRELASAAIKCIVINHEDFIPSIVSCLIILYRSPEKYYRNIAKKLIKYLGENDTVLDYLDKSSLFVSCLTSYKKCATVQTRRPDNMSQGINLQPEPPC